MALKNTGNLTSLSETQILRAAIPTLRSKAYAEMTSENPASSPGREGGF